MLKDKLQENIKNDLNLIYESLDNDAAKKLFVAVVDLQDEIKDFEKDATPAAINALTPHLEGIKNALGTIMKDVTSYVPNASEPEGKPTKQVKVFKAAK